MLTAEDPSKEIAPCASIESNSEAYAAFRALIIEDRRSPAEDRAAIELTA